MVSTLNRKSHIEHPVMIDQAEANAVEPAEAPGGSPECHWITRLHVEVQQFGVPSFKQAVGSPGIHLRKLLDPFRAVVQKHRQRNSVARRQI